MVWPCIGHHTPYFAVGTRPFERESDCKIIISYVTTSESDPQLVVKLLSRVRCPVRTLYIYSIISPHSITSLLLLPVSLLSAEPPRGNEKCPRRNGFFAHPNEQICNIFYNCIDGVATETICSPGLHFDELSGVCDWPDKVAREGCSAVKSMPNYFVIIRHQNYSVPNLYLKSCDIFLLFRREDRGRRRFRMPNG